MANHKINYMVNHMVDYVVNHVADFVVDYVVIHSDRLTQLLLRPRGRGLKNRKNANISNLLCDLLISVKYFTNIYFNT